MRKSVVVFLMLVCVAYLTGCGGSSSSTASTTVYDLPVPVSAPTSRTLLGGSIQGGVAVVFSSPVAAVETFAGSSAGFNNISSAGIATFNRPIAVTTDGNNNLYVADYLNNVIRKINIASKHVTTLAGNVAGMAGSANGNGLSASFNRPNSITSDGTSLYVTDSVNFTIRKIVIATGDVTTLAGGVGVSGSVDALGINARFNALNGITTDGNSLYVTDSNNTIRRIVIASGNVTTLAGTPGSSGSADGIQSAARFNVPARITTDGPNLYVTDFGNSTIRKIALATGTVTTIAGKVGPGESSGVVEGLTAGVFAADSTDGTGQTARFNQPNGITTDGFNLYVTDSYYNTVRKIVLSSGTVYSGPVTTLATIGTAALNSTTGITTDGKSLFITDFTTATGLSHTIRKIQ